MVEAHSRDDQHEITPENPLSFIKFIEKMKIFFDVVVRGKLNTETASVLGDDELIKTLVFSMNYIEIDLARDSQEDAKRFKVAAKHILESIEAIVRGDSNERLHNSLDILIDGLSDFKHLNHELVDENFVRLQELGKLDLSLVDKYLSSGS